MTNRYTGYTTDRLGMTYLHFNVNGKRRTIAVDEDDVVGLAGQDIGADLDDCREILDRCIASDPDEYINDWEIE